MKRTLAVLLSILMLATMLAGCGEQAPSQNAPVATEAPTAENAAAESPVEEAKPLDWPKRTITIQVTDPGGDMDYMGRLLAQKMSEDLGVNVVVANNEGAVLPLRNTIAADADGYTIWIGKTSLPIERALGSMEGIDLNKEITFIGNLVDNPALCITVKPELGVTTIPELIELSKTMPDELKITDNIGSNTNVTCMLLEKAGAQLTEVDVGGTSAKMAAFLGGHCDVMVCSYPSQRDYVEAGEFVVLGQVSAERNPMYPDVPTCKEQGEDIVFDTSLFVAVKAGTDEAIVSFLSDYFQNIVENDSSFAEEVASAQLMVPAWRDGAAVAKILDDQYQTLIDIGFAEG